MFSREIIDNQYKNAAQKQGVKIEIAYAPGLPKTQEIVETGGEFTIKLNSDRVSEADYEEYVSYNARKIILPRLRLETGRLRLRRFERSDAEDCFAFLSCKEDAYMDDGVFFISMDEDYNRLMDDYAEQTRYMIVLKETGRAIGSINLFDDHTRAVETKEIGYVIAPEYKRRGYAFEALSAFLRYLLYDLNLQLAVAGVIPDNIPSIGLIEKLGFQYEGRKHKAYWNEMRGPVDLRYYYLEKNMLPPADGG